MRYIQRFWPTAHAPSLRRTSAQRWNKYVARLPWKRQRTCSTCSPGAARAARYALFAPLPADFVALAQHEDDQAETVLLQLARGAGPAGLAGMPTVRAHAGRRRRPPPALLRPLLGVTRAEIEAVLIEHPAVLEAAVVGVPDRRMGEELAAFLRVAGETPDVEALRAHVRGRLAAPKAPRYWVFLTEFPLTGSGKIQKFVLRERWDAGAFVVIDAVGERTARS